MNYDFQKKTKLTIGNYLPLPVHPKFQQFF